MGEGHKVFVEPCLLAVQRAVSKAEIFHIYNKYKIFIYIILGYNIECLDP